MGITYMVLNVCLFINKLPFLYVNGLMFFINDLNSHFMSCLIKSSSRFDV